MRLCKDNPGSLRLLLALMTLGFGLLSSIAVTHERVSFGPEPAWVLPSAHAFKPLSETNSGEVLVLMDNQANLETGERFSHFCRKFLNRSGVQNASSLVLSFDPSFEYFAFHRLAIRRGEQVLNVLDPDKIQILQREKHLERHLYDGEISLLFMLHDLRVGDELEYSYSIRGENPVFAGKFSDTAALADTITIQN